MGDLRIKRNESSVVDMNSDPVDFLEDNAVFVKVVNTVVQDSIQQKLRIHHHNEPVILHISTSTHRQRNVIDILASIPHLSSWLEHL